MYMYNEPTRINWNNVKSLTLRSSLLVVLTLSLARSDCSLSHAHQPFHVWCEQYSSNYRSNLCETFLRAIGTRKNASIHASMHSFHPYRRFYRHLVSSPNEKLSYAKSGNSIFQYHVQRKAQNISTSHIPKRTFISQNSLDINTEVYAYCYIVIVIFHLGRRLAETRKIESKMNLIYSVTFFSRDYLSPF